MNINRENYEEYFLLYADNELSAQEKSAVEAFVKQYPDLEEELLIIKLSVNKPDDNCILEDKDFLFKETSKFINHSNYEEIFVLYNDNELTLYEREETESFLLKNLSFRNEFELLQRSKLQADHTIVFDEKKLLYRKEHAGKVIVLKWWKVAAAAVLLGMGIWSGVAYFQNNDKDLQSVVKPNTVKKINKVNPPSSDAKQKEPVIVVAKKETKKQEQNPIAKRSISKPVVKRSLLPNGLPEVKNQAPTNDLPTNDAITKNINKIPIPELKTEIDPTENVDIDNSANKLAKADELVNINNDSSSKTLTASFAVDENENNNNYAFYNITQEKFNRSKIGGFLRKVKRIIERKISPLNNTKDKTEIAVN